MARAVDYFAINTFFPTEDEEKSPEELAEQEKEQYLYDLHFQFVSLLEYSDHWKRDFKTYIQDLQPEVADLFFNNKWNTHYCIHPLKILFTRKTCYKRYMIVDAFLKKCDSIDVQEYANILINETYKVLDSKINQISMIDILQMFHLLQQYSYKYNLFLDCTLDDNYVKKTEHFLHVSSLFIQEKEGKLITCYEEEELASYTIWFNFVSDLLFYTASTTDFILK